MKKKHKNMTPEEQREEDIRIAERDSRWAVILSLTAILINIIKIILKAIS